MALVLDCARGLQLEPPCAVVARRPILLSTEICINLYCLITVVNKIIVFLNNCISKKKVCYIMD